MVLKAEKLTLMIALVAVIGTFTVVIPLQAFGGTTTSGTVVGTTTVPQFCGLKQLAVLTEPDFTEVSLPIIFDETVDLQVSNQETLRVANTGGGDAEVNADLIKLQAERKLTEDDLKILKFRIKQAQLEFTKISAIFSTINRNVFIAGPRHTID